MGGKSPIQAVKIKLDAENFYGNQLNPINILERKFVSWFDFSDWVRIFPQSCEFFTSLFYV